MTIELNLLKGNADIFSSDPQFVEHWKIWFISSRGPTRARCTKRNLYNRQHIRLNKTDSKLKNHLTCEIYVRVARMTDQDGGTILILNSSTGMLVFIDRLFMQAVLKTEK